ncbi:MAG: LPS export ABC transporter periplasmic protein LptC [Maricaulaceae bacterium]
MTDAASSAEDDPHGLFTPRETRAIDALDWEGRRSTTLKAARARSDMVRRLRLVLLSAAGLAGVSIIGVIVSFALGGGDPVIEDPQERTRLVKPRFTGSDEDGRPYVLVAETAQTDQEDASKTVLSDPALDFSADGTEGGLVTAPVGRFDPESRELEMLENVVFERADGLTLRSTQALIEVAENRVNGDAPVRVEGEFGTIDAQGFRIEDGGNRVVFKGRARLVLYNEIADPDAETDVDTEETR